MAIAILGAVLLLGGVIFFHELGHYSVAKMFGIRVEVFSLGFGKKIISRVWGKTEYCVSLIPLGGYVKLMGDDPTKPVPLEDQKHSFSHQTVGKRFAVVAAGPIANFLLAFALLSLVLWVGQPTAGTTLGDVDRDSPSWTAGLRPGDKVIAIGPKKVQTWEEVEEAVKRSEGNKLPVSVLRHEHVLTLQVPIGMVDGRDTFGEIKRMAGMEGTTLLPRAPVVAISNPNSVAGLAGLKSFTRIEAIDNHPLGTLHELNDSLLEHAGKRVTLTVSPASSQSDSANTGHKIELSIPPTQGAAASMGATLGLYPADVFVDSVSPGSPAEKGGLKAGDRIAKIDETEAHGFSTITNYVQSQGLKHLPVKFTLERQGKAVHIEILPKETEETDPYTQRPYRRFLVGYHPSAYYSNGETVAVPVRNPVILAQKAIEECVHLLSQMASSLYRLALGKMSVKNFGGPVAIASIAGKSLHAGVIPLHPAAASILNFKGLEARFAQATGIGSKYPARSR